MAYFLKFATIDQATTTDSPLAVLLELGQGKNIGFAWHVACFLEASVRSIWEGLDCISQTVHQWDKSLVDGWKSSSLVKKWWEY